MRVHSITHNTATNGPGRRNILHTAGCSIRCPGCFSPHTWKSAGQDMSVGDIVEALLHGDPDGISISGGEPTEQMDDLLRLAMVLWPMFQSKKGLLLFSGTSPEQREALPLWGALQRNLDAAILGPYKEELAIRRPTDMRSSSNQRIEVYGKAITAEELHGLPQIEVIIAKSGRTMLGFPNREDIKCLQS